jgi:hypothetical protein
MAGSFRDASVLTSLGHSAYTPTASRSEVSSNNWVDTIRSWGGPLRVRGTPNTQRYAVSMIAGSLIDVLQEVAPDLAATTPSGTLAVRTANGRATRPVVTRASLTPAAAQRLVDGTSKPGLVIADLIHSGAEELLQRRDWSYWDRRGRLRLWLPEIGVRLDVPTRSYVTGADGPDPRRPVAGSGGIALALGLLQRSDDPPGIREIARLAEMAPSTISRARSHLTKAGLIASDGTPVVPEFFWATSEAWVVRPVSVDVEPDGEGWVLGGDAAAASWGAPVLATSRRYYCIDRTLFDRHRLRHRAEESGIEIAMAPSPLVVATAAHRVVHPVVAALDLSTSSRGREILADWTSIEPALAHAEAVWR